jgi:hypothetical protein
MIFLDCKALLLDLPYNDPKSSSSNAVVNQIIKNGQVRLFEPTTSIVNIIA